MILIGRDLSPFVRRVAIWCALQGREVERRQLAAMGPDWEQIRARNPVGRVPILVLDDGTQLIESFAICDWLEETAPEGRRLVPEAGAPRLAAMQLIALAHSVSEKIVALVYEKNRRPEALHWHDWQERVVSQVQGGLAALDVSVPAQGFHGGESPDGGDVTAVVAWQMAEATNPWLLEDRYPRLKALAERAMALPAFADTVPRP